MEGSAIVNNIPSSDALIAAVVVSPTDAGAALVHRPFWMEKAFCVSEPLGLLVTKFRVLWASAIEPVEYAVIGLKAGIVVIVVDAGHCVRYQRQKRTRTERTIRPASRRRIARYPIGSKHLTHTIRGRLCVKEVKLRPLLA